MRQKLAVTLVIIALVADLILVEGKGRSGPKPGKHPGHSKKKISDKAKIAMAAGAGALGGGVIGSGLSHGQEDQMRNHHHHHHHHHRNQNHNQNYVNGTGRNGGMGPCPMETPFWSEQY